jgi:hypothetical protein
MAMKYIKWRYNMPNIDKIHQHLTWQDSPKFTQIPLFGLKKTIWQPWSRGAQQK